MVEFGRKEAVKFLEEKFEISNIEEKLTGGKLNLINEIIRTYAEKIPFQNVHMTSVPSVNDRHVPTEEEILQYGLNLQGGLCLNLNYFIMMLLKALGFDAYIAGGQYTPRQAPNSHMVTFVRNLEKPGDLHLVEVGNGFPTFQAIPVNQLPLTLSLCGLDIRYEKDGDRINRYHRKQIFGRFAENEKIIMKDGWQLMNDMDTIERDLSFFTPYMHGVFTTGDYYNELRLIRYPGPGNNMIAIKGYTEYIYSENEPEKGTRKVPIPKDVDWIEFIAGRFPSLDKTALKKSIAFFKKVWENNKC